MTVIRSGEASRGQHDRTYAIFGRACESLGIENFYPKPPKKKRKSEKRKRQP